MNESDINTEQLQSSLASIASELFRLQRVFEKAISKLELDEQRKYQSQFSWFLKRVEKAFDSAGLTLVNLEGERYDVGMAITPININDFEVNDALYVAQMVEPIIIRDGRVYRTGTAILGRL